MEPETAPRREYEQQTSAEAVDNGQDVYLNIPDLYVESLDLQVTDLRARVSLQAEVLNLLRLNVGVDAVLGQVRLDLTNVQAQALLKVRLDKVAEILNRVLDTIDSHPEMIESLARASVAAVERAGTTVQQTLGEVGDIAEPAVQRVVQNVDQLSRGVQEQVMADQSERGLVRPAPVEGPPAIDPYARVEAESRRARPETRQARPETRQARPESRQGRQETGQAKPETRETDRAGRQRPSDEPRRFRGLPRRADGG